MRPEIQALRALAVIGVLLFHLWPQRLTGGYVGVDVFFVVSGFLITDHLVREYERRGRVDLPSFWARRARRLLPASLLVLALTAVAVYLWIPVVRWAQFGWEIIAGAFYVENWALASQSVDYMATSNAKSPVQHFWTLGVEEQFYLVWPIVLALAAVVAVRAGRRGARGMAWAVGGIVAASFVYSVVFTWASPSIAYYSTFTRAWEFGAGALLAMALRRHAVPFRPAVATVLSWLGFALIAATMVVYSGATPFPSYTALVPVVGTALVIASGAPRARLSPTPLMAWRPVQFVGDVSYGVYLWHWPLIVLIPYITGHPLTTLECLAILAVSLVLGWASKRFVEDPVRSLPALSRGRARRSLLGALTAMIAVTALALPLALYTVPAPPRTADEPPNCWGAAAMTDPACGPADAIDLVSPAAAFAADLPSDTVRACEITVELATFRRCDLAAGEPGARHVALVGDSHATRWVEAFERAAEDDGFALSTYLVSGCPLVSAEPLGGVWGYDPVGAQLCPQPTSAVLADITADPAITDVVLTNRTRLYLSGSESDHPLTPAPVAATIRTLQAAGKNVIVLADYPEIRKVPQQGGGSAIDCLSLRDTSGCWMPRADADFTDPMRQAAQSAGAPVIDLTDQFCDADRCLWQIGGLVVYTDDNHLTRSFSASLAPALSAALIGAGVSASTP